MKESESILITRPRGLRRSVLSGAAAVAVLLLVAGSSAVGRSDGSGGPAVAHYAGGHKLSSPAVQRHSPVAKLHRIGRTAVEPTLGLTEDGTILYTAFAASNSIEVVRSSDKGETWELVSPRTGPVKTHQISVDPYLWIDEDTDRVFNIDLTVACSYLSFSDDKGDSWFTNPLACGRPVNDHQTLFGGPPATTETGDYPNLLYYCWNDVLTSSCSKSTDGGVTFLVTRSPAFTSCGGLHGHGHVGRDGTVYLPKGHCGEPYLAFSTDEGDSWTQVQVADNGSADHEAGVATDKRGNIYFTWIGRDGLPYLAVSKDKGESWSKPMMIGAPGVREANLPGIDVSPGGGVAIVYMGTENVEGAFGSRNYAGATWNGYITMTTDALGKRPIFYSAPVNDREKPFVTGRCGPGRCQAVLDFIDVVIGPDGTPWGAFIDGVNGGEGVVGRLVGGPRLR